MGYRDFEDAYIETMVWANAYGEDPWGGLVPLSETLTPDADVSPGALADMEADAARFWQLICELTNPRGELSGTIWPAWLPEYSDAQAGHDFALTRNGHGAGFWDRGLGELGSKLTRMARAEGGSYLTVGDDGLLS